jgi:dolichol-phosphate mannosyltransferase
MNEPISSFLQRWMRFNLVGLIGMALQLTSLAILHRAMPCHNLIATALATEITLLHNFLWHWHYTWRDRRSATTPLRQLIRFHLSNGLVSFAGNLGLVGLLTHTTHLPLLADTVIAILCCSLANFLLGHHWTFNPQLPKDANMPSTPRHVHELKSRTAG